MIESVTRYSASLDGPPRFVTQGSKLAGSRVPSQEGRQSDEERAVIESLKQRDRQVRAHEMAHVAAGGVYVKGGANFGYTTGPDGMQYATSGEVSIDISPGRTPEETIDKARAIRGAALAPADPSPQDHAVAAQAARMEMEATIELALQRQGDGGNAVMLRVEALLPRVGLYVDTAA